MKTALRILVVEDDKYFLLHLREILSTFGVVETALNWPAAQSLLAQGSYDVVVTDLYLDQSALGMKVLDEARRQGSLRLVLTATTDETLITEAYRRGAQHVLSKQNSQETVPAYLKGLLHQRHQHQLEQTIAGRFPISHAATKAQVLRLLTTPWHGRSLLLTGPTGTGKSLLGKLVAELVFGAEAPFVHLNCSEIPDNLLEAELFGHEKGAFTGAEQRREGKLKLADGGVLFLDEVGTMSQAMQQKLLKAIDEKTFYPIGSTKPEKSRFTLITATCEDLLLKIKQGLFREDLYFRLAGLSIRLPALSERSDDIPTLVRLFQAQSHRRFVITQDAMDLLQAQSWPGNIRELRQVITNLADGGSGVVDAAMVQASFPKRSAGRDAEAGLMNDEIRRYVQTHGLRAYFQLIEQQLALETMERHQGKITSCIRELKISSSAFYRILQERQVGG